MNNSLPNTSAVIRLGPAIDLSDGVIPHPPCLENYLLLPFSSSEKNSRQLMLYIFGEKLLSSIIIVNS